MQRVRYRPAAQIAVAKVQRPRRFDALEARRDQIGRLLRRHHPHIDLRAKNRGVELHVGAAFIGHGAQFRVNDLGHRRHLRRNGVDLVAAGDDDLVGRDYGGLAHTSRQLLFPAKGFQITKAVRRGDVADDLGVGHVIIVEHIIGLGLVDFEPSQAFVHVQDEIIGVVFTAGPFVETQIPLLLDRLGCRAIEDSLAFLGRTFTRVIPGQILFHLRVKPP